MQRRLLIIAIFLLLGAVVNVAVAWGFAVFVPLDYLLDRSYVVLPASELVWRLHVDSRPGALRIDSNVSMVDIANAPEHSLPKWSRASKPPTQKDLNTPLVREQARGWPLLSLYRREGEPAGYHSGAIVVATRRFLPLIPIWRGIAVNTLFYAAILWLLIHGPFALRRLLRVRHGLCPKCAYPMGDSSVCTECGNPLPRWQRLPT